MKQKHHMKEIPEYYTLIWRVLNYGKYLTWNKHLISKKITHMNNIFVCFLKVNSQGISWRTRVIISCKSSTQIRQFLPQLCCGRVRRLDYDGHVIWSQYAFTIIVRGNEWPVPFAHNYTPSFTSILQVHSPFSFWEFINVFPHTALFSC